MEPFNTNDVDVNGGDVDLTDDLLFDIGWDGGVNCAVNNFGFLPTVNVLGCDSGVENRKGEYVVIPSKTWLPGQFGAVAGGCYLQDVVNSCFPLLTVNGQVGQYRSCIAQVTSDLKQQGLLSKNEAGKIQACAGSGN